MLTAGTEKGQPDALKLLELRWMNNHDKPFYASNHRAPPRQPQPGEFLWSFRNADRRQIDVELRDHGPYGVEAQFFCDREFLYSRRFDTRALAVQWAEEERKVLQTDQLNP